MLRFKDYIFESTDESKLTHLEHLEDHPINAGHEGLKHAVSNLAEVHRKLTGGTSKAKVTTKMDGSPSIVFGHHPETGKFFVSSKSAFNKSPKINYTHDDIEKNHGHAPGLVEKLKSAMDHLPKVTPKKGVFQGDVMHSGASDVKKEGSKVHFTPNTITYSTDANSHHGKAALGSKFGVAVHTAYHGPSFHEMKAEYAPKLSTFGKHKDVHMIPVEHSTEHVKYGKDEQKKFKTHLKSALSASKGIDHAAISHHQIPLKTYINHTIRTGTKPSVDGFVEHYKGSLQKKVDGVKTAKAKAEKTATMNSAIDHVNSNRHHFQKMLTTHHHLQKAKNVLVNALSSHSDFHHSIAGKDTKPEGHVVVINNRPTKFVDRHEFSAANFNRS